MIVWNEIFFTCYKTLLIFKFLGILKRVKLFKLFVNSVEKKFCCENIFYLNFRRFLGFHRFRPNCFYENVKYRINKKKVFSLYPVKSIQNVANQSFHCRNQTANQKPGNLKYCTPFNERTLIGQNPGGK